MEQEEFDLGRVLGIALQQILHRAGELPVGLHDHRAAIHVQRCTEIQFEVLGEGA